MTSCGATSETQGRHANSWDWHVTNVCSLPPHHAGRYHHDQGHDMEWSVEEAHYVGRTEMLEELLDKINAAARESEGHRAGHEWVDAAEVARHEILALLDQAGYS